MIDVECNLEHCLFKVILSAYDLMHKEDSKAFYSRVNAQHYLNIIRHTWLI